jgi:type IV fimbrial biogenesis protein FimT
VPHAARRRPQMGTSLIESLTTLGIAVAAMAAALPSFGLMVDRLRLNAAAAQLETDVQWGRSLAVLEGRSLRLSIAQGPQGACYVLHTGPAHACVCAADTSSCAGDAVALRTSALEQEANLLLGATATSIQFNHVTGTVTPTSTMKLESRRGEKLSVVVNIMGRVRTCSPTGLAGHAAC